MPPNLDLLNPIRPVNRPQREPLAVIGIGCRFPGGIDSPTAYWDALLRELNAICDVPEDRWNHARFHDTNSEKVGSIRNARGGFIDGIDQFDGEFFGYFPAEAQRIDPQQRMLLEVTHEAMEDAGLRRDQLDGTRTSVFIGSFMYDYLCMQTASEQRDEINPYVAMGCAVSPLANRISYDFNLKGPSVSLDTACSSSLVAVHLACRSLWNGDCRLHQRCSDGEVRYRPAELALPRTQSGNRLGQPQAGSPHAAHSAGMRRPSVDRRREFVRRGWDQCACRVARACFHQPQGASPRFGRDSRPRTGR